MISGRSHLYFFSSFSSLRGLVMNTKTDLRRAFGRVESRCGDCRRANGRKRRGITLIEVLVVIGIIGILVALFLPAVRTSREGARRSQCICNLKQLALAIQNHHDTRTSFPMASTSPLVPDAGIQKYGAVGAAPEAAELATNGTAGQQDDGYSWIAQCLPFMEENELYGKMTAAQDKPVVRYGKLADAAFAPSSNRKLEATATDASPYFWSAKISTFVCPSFPGEDQVDSFGDIPKSKVATGNYVALAATHYRSNPSNHLESLFPVGEVRNAGGHDCTNVRYCGNGGMPFPGVRDGRIQKVGLSVRNFRNGTSKVPVIVESREETLTSWYSGLASYVVAAMPPPNGSDPVGVEVAPGQFAWKCNDTTKCDIALNKGDPKSINPGKYYQPVSPHGGGPRVWGPSSRHPGVVMHGYADGHVEAINDNIDKNVYLQLVQRNANEVVSQ
jgi:prepilin-type N-terminal cleavage/methylation domain-containing protein